MWRWPSKYTNESRPCDMVNFGAFYRIQWEISAGNIDQWERMDFEKDFRLSERRFHNQEFITEGNQNYIKMAWQNSTQKTENQHRTHRKNLFNFLTLQKTINFVKYRILPFISLSLQFGNNNSDATIHCHLYSNTLRRIPISCKYYLEF